MADPRRFLCHTSRTDYVHGRGSGVGRRAEAERRSKRGRKINAIDIDFFPPELTTSVFADLDRGGKNLAQTYANRNRVKEGIDGRLLFWCSRGSVIATVQDLVTDIRGTAA
ncbi:MAG: hypothetical protein KJO42_09815 [Silicimonas sp.]|nr:hypothetical protein [Silicimonas sp.]